MARPTKLTPELIEKAKGYLATCYDRPIYTDKGAMTYVEVNLPSKVGLAIYLDVDKNTVTEWCKEVPIDTENENPQRKEFSIIVGQVMSEQEKRLINNGLGGLYKEKTNSMMLAHNHGYVTDKTETDITTKGDKIQSALLPEIIAEADRILKEKKLNE